MPERKRLPKYTRTKQNVPLRIQSRDTELIHLVYQYRFLQTDHLTALLEANKGSIYRRLKKLYHNRYLDRLFFPVQFYSGGPEPFVYALDVKGAEVLAEELGIRYEELKWSIDQNKIQERYLRHGLMVSNFHTILACGAKDQDQLNLIFWRQGKELEDEVIFEDEKGHKLRAAVVPDAFFSLEDKRPGREGRMYFFLECDRSTMTTRRFLRKMQGYWHYWLQGKQTRKFGIQNYRVLTLTKSRQRRDNLAEITQKADERQTGSYMFWFSTEKDLKLDHPLTIFKQNWKTAEADDQTFHSLLE